MLSQCCDAIDILGVAATAPLVLDSAYTPLLDGRNRCMSLARQPCDSIPEETIRVARAAFPHRTRLIQRRDHLGTMYHQSAFAALSPPRGKLAAAPWRLALITVRPGAEDGTDRAAANAVRRRMDWQYALR
jgi:transposase